MATDVIKRHCVKNVKFKIIKTRTGCQSYVAYLCRCEKLNWAAQNTQLGRGLDIAGLNELREWSRGWST